ncbi:hypothetical protein FRC17_009939 [Serendipita sp. 399]|nr:hypothetical protein FRC17_009939 [Serendipita sp. 399]
MASAQSSFSAWVSSLLGDLKAVYELLVSSEIPRPLEGSLAREAVDEAFDQLAVFRDWLASATTPPAPGIQVTGLEKLMATVPADAPILLVLPVLLNGAWLEQSLSLSLSLSTSSSLSLSSSSYHTGSDAAVAAASSLENVSMAKLVGYDDEETYRRQVLCGFGRAEECEAVVVQRVLERLRGMNGLASGSINSEGEGWTGPVRRWLEARA